MSDYESVADQVSSGGKYSDLDHSNQYIQEGRRIFKNRALEAARKGNSAALEAEDMWFSRPHYAYALAQYCKAHGISPEMLRAANEVQKKYRHAGRKGEVFYQGKSLCGKKHSYRQLGIYLRFSYKFGRYGRGRNAASVCRKD